jgi:hypothetical protein
MTDCFLDTNIIIRCFRNDPDITKRLLESIQDGWTFYYSVVTLAEIYAGCKPGQEEAVRNFFFALNFLPIDEATGVRAGRILQKFARHQGVEMADALIAAGCLEHELELWTLNRKHFPSPGLVFFE